MRNLRNLLKFFLGIHISYGYGHDLDSQEHLKVFQSSVDSHSPVCPLNFYSQPLILSRSCDAMQLLPIVFIKHLRDRVLTESDL